MFLAGPWSELSNPPAAEEEGMGPEDADDVIEGGMALPIPGGLLNCESVGGGGGAD